MSEEMQNRPTSLEQLHTMIQDHDGHEDLTALHSELSSEKPNTNAVSTLLERLSGDPAIGAKVQLWLNDAQPFLADLNAMGL